MPTHGVVYWQLNPARKRKEAESILTENPKHLSAVCYVFKA